MFLSPTSAQLIERLIASPYCNRRTDVNNRASSKALDDVCPVVFLGALVLKIRDGGSVQRRACYLALVIDMDGEREVLGMWSQANEGTESSGWGPDRPAPAWRAGHRCRAVAACPCECSASTSPRVASSQPCSMRADVATKAAIRLGELGTLASEWVGHPRRKPPLASTSWNTSSGRLAMNPHCRRGTFPNTSRLGLLCA